MKNLFTYLSVLALAFFLFSCGEDNGGTDTASSDLDMGEESMQSDSDGANKAVCLWDPVGLRDKPGRADAKYLTGIKFGEVVNLTGEEEEIASEKRTYIEMELSDGKKGWANEYLFAIGGTPVVATSDIDVFSRPDLSTLGTDKISSGELFAMIESEENEGWAEFFTKEKKKKGWIQVNSSMYTDDPINIALGKQLSEVSGMESTAAKMKALKNLQSSSTFASSDLMPMVEEMLQQLDKASNLPNTQLMITATNLNVRSEPDTEADNVVFQVTEGDVCDILERSSSKVEIRDMNDYWYKIEKDGRTGWVYGHYTSKSL
jgi:uncharacterized protein YgiM (DUF1202 family)